MSKYTTQSQIESVLQRDLTTQEEAIIDDVIEAVSETLNTYTGRRWFDVGETSADVVEETRYFGGNRGRELFVDDFISISSLQLLDSLGTVIDTLSTAYYILAPSNTTWKNSIYLRDRRFSNHPASVKITGIFYTGEVPTAIKLATATLVGLFFSSARNVGDYKKESIEGYAYEILTGEEKTNQELSVLSKVDHWRKISI